MPSTNRSSKQETTTRPVRTAAEKRYRSKIQQKFTILRDSVPTLRAASAAAGQPTGNDDGTSIGGLTPAWKLNKGVVLNKAAEYIKYMEQQRQRLQEENWELKTRLDCLVSSMSSQQACDCFKKEINPVYNNWSYESPCQRFDVQQSDISTTDLLDYTPEYCASVSDTSPAAEDVPLHIVLQALAIPPYDYTIYEWGNTQF